jgi:hypothetical protein
MMAYDAVNTTTPISAALFFLSLPSRREAMPGSLFSRGRHGRAGILDCRVTAFLAMMVYDVVNTATQSPQQGEAQMLSSFRALVSYSNENALHLQEKTEKFKEYVTNIYIILFPSYNLI